MSVSSIPTMFSESPEQSSSSELSDELTTALAEGRWWAIMEVSDPISEENEYVDLISGQWGDTVEAGETSCPTSLVLSSASEKAQRKSQCPDFIDATLKTSKQWRQKPYSDRSKHGAPVPASPEKGDSTSSPFFSGASEKTANSGFSDATLKTMKKRKKQRAKKPQGAPGSETTEGRKPTSFPVFGDGSEKAESPQWRQKPQKAPDGSTQGAHVLVRSQKNSAASKEGDLTSSLVFSDASEKPEFISVASLKARDQRRQFRKKKPQVAPVPVGSPQGPPVPVGSQQRGKLRIPDHLVRHLQKASSELGAPLPAGSQQGVSPQETPKSLQRAPVAAPNGAPMPDKIPKRQKLKIPEPLRRELLKQKPLASSVQGVSNPAKSKQDTTVPDRTPVGAPVHAGTQQRAAVPARAPHAVPVSAESPKGAAVPAPSTQGAPMPSRIAKVAPVLSGTPQGAHVPAGSPQQEANLKFPMQWREQWRQQNIPAKTQQGTLVPPTSGDAGVDASPPQKLYMEIYNKVQLNLKLRSQNHQLHQRTWSHRKRALDNAGVDQSLPPKKPRTDQQSEPEQIDDLCRMFTKFSVISHI